MQNSSGIQPINCNVLVIPDPVEEKKGSILLPDSIREKDQHAQMAGTVVAASDDAFSDEYGKPSWDIGPGTRIIFARYAGKKVVGPADGAEYWLMKDKDVTGFEA